MKVLNSLPESGQFVVVWEYNENVFSNSFEVAGQNSDGEVLYAPFNIHYDRHDYEALSLAFFLSYPHTIIGV